MTRGRLSCPLSEETAVLNLRRLPGRLPIDPYLLMLIATVALAAALPAQGAFRPIVDKSVYGAIAALFFLYGARLSLWVGLLAVGIGTVSGTLIGLICGYWEGRVDLVLQRFMDALQTIPGLILALAIVSVLKPNTTNAMLAIAVVIIPGNSRIVRGAVLSAKQNPYVEAARALGCGHLRIIASHILPNVTAPILIIASIWLGNAIFIEASLSFLGLGTKPPNPSWGLMLSSTGRAFMEQAPWLAIFPGLAISLAVLGFNLFGDTLRDIWDPKLRGRS